MPRAVIQDGAIVPLEPLPSEWANGTEVNVETTPAESPAEIDRAFDELERVCAAGTESDYMALQRALAEADRESKAWIRREMGLAE
jgi:hypothetical protein